MTWTKNSTATVDGVQWIRYHVTDTAGVGYSVSFTMAAVLAANPSIDAGILASTLTAFRAYGDTQCGFADV